MNKRRVMGGLWEGFRAFFCQLWHPPLPSGGKGLSLTSFWALPPSLKPFSVYVQHMHMYSTLIYSTANASSSRSPLKRENGFFFIWPHH